MRVRELIKALKQLPQNDAIAITAMDDMFFCSDFEVHSLIEDGTQEIIMNVYVNSYTNGDY